MDGAQEFANKLNFIERELTALKTAHMHPLGSVSFYRRQQDIRVDLPQEEDNRFAVVVKIESSSYTPIVQIGFFIAQAARFSIDGTGIRNNGTEIYYNLSVNRVSSFVVDFTFDVISSVGIVDVYRTGVI